MLAARRRARLSRILSLVRTWPGMRVLDVGCGIDGRSFSDHVDTTWRIVGIDVEPAARIRHAHPGFEFRGVDVRDMREFRDGEFDLVVSFGMLEHITGEADYAAACRELQRVGRQFAILVPYRWAWLEPHYKFPFFGALPRSFQRALIRWFNLCGHRDRLDYFESNFAWRSNAQYRRDFPGARIRFMPTLETIAIVRSAL